MYSNFTGQESERFTSVRCIVEVDTETVKIIKTFAYCIMLLIALGGNVILVCVVSLQRKLRTTTNCLICNMAISDLLVPIFAMPRTIVEIHLGHRRWLFSGTVGLALCKVIYFLQDVSTAVSVLSLSVITIDRFYAVVRPERSTPIKGRIKPVIGFIWTTAMLMHAPYFYTFELVKQNDMTFCFLLWPDTVDRNLATKCFFLSLIVLLYFIPLFWIAILQGMIVKRLRKQRLPSFSSSLRQRKRGKRNKNVVYFTLAVIVTFFVCWTPTIVYSFIVIYGENSICIPELFRFASLFLVQSNSSLNFFVYFIFNKNFRKTFKKLLSSRKASFRVLRRAETVQLPVRGQEIKTSPARKRTLTIETLSEPGHDFKMKTLESQVMLERSSINNETLEVSEKLLPSKHIIQKGNEKIEEGDEKARARTDEESILSGE